MNANISWLYQVVQDANIFAEANLPRTQNTLKHAMKPHLPAETSTAHKGVVSLFAENLWPSLRTCSWTAVVLNEGEVIGETCYVYSGKQYHSPHAVLNAVPGIHPELSKIVETILLSTTKPSELHEEDPRVNKNMSLHIDNISCPALSSFFCTCMHHFRGYVTEPKILRSPWLE